MITLTQEVFSKKYGWTHTFNLAVPSTSKLVVEAWLKAGLFADEASMVQTLIHGLRIKRAEILKRFPKARDAEAAILAGHVKIGSTLKIVQVEKVEVPKKLTPEQIATFNLTEDQLQQMLDAGVISAETETD